jgi:FlaA1/EpsC-like NDP-sugar epimerase
MHHAQRRILSHLLDLSAFVISAILAFELRFDGALPAQYFHPLWVALCIWAAVKTVSFIALHVGWQHWRHTSTHDVIRIIVANSIGSIFGGACLLFLFSSGTIPRSVYIIDWLISCLLTFGGRLAIRVVINQRQWSKVKGERVRTLIYGAGAAGLALLRELHQNPALLCDAIGLVDDDLQKVGLILEGKKVLGTGKDLRELVRRHDVARILIAIPTASGAQMARIMKFASDAEVEYKMVPGLGELVQGTELGKQIRNISVEDLLGRKAVHLNLDLIHKRIQGRVVMVTGAAGSIGSEICRQIAHFQPLAIVAYDQAETPLFNIDREMKKKFPNVIFHPEIGDITQLSSLHRVMQNYQPSILYHAAAYKHVPLMERHVFAAVETNIFGTWKVANAAIENGIEDFVMISSDKAVQPTNMMGATKRVAELLIKALNSKSETKFVAVRFGNVLGSNGSVVPIFKEQIAAGGPVTVTHPEMRRYFMTIPEAAQLVLQAFSIGKGGEIFVLDMGEPVKIADLASNLILLSGLRPHKDIEIQYTGLRPGEKMFEELNLSDEHLVTTSHPKIRSYINNHNPDTKQIKLMLQRLQQIAENQDVGNLVLLMKDLIPDYNPSAQLLKAAIIAEPFPVGITDNLPVARARAEATVIRMISSSAPLN